VVGLGARGERARGDRKVDAPRVRLLIERLRGLVDTRASA
jgi:hypothetical protein